MQDKLRFILFLYIIINLSGCKCIGSGQLCHSGVSGNIEIKKYIQVIRKQCCSVLIRRRNNIIWKILKWQKILHNHLSGRKYLTIMKNDFKKFKNIVVREKSMMILALKYDHSIVNLPKILLRQFGEKYDVNSVGTVCGQIVGIGQRRSAKMDIIRFCARPHKVPADKSAIKAGIRTGYRRLPHRIYYVNLCAGRFHRDFLRH